MSRIKVGSSISKVHAILSSPALMATKDVTPNIPNKRGSLALQMGPQKKHKLVQFCQGFYNHPIAQLHIWSACLPWTSLWLHSICIVQLPFPAY